MNKTLLNQAIHNLIAVGSVLIGITLCKLIIEQDVNMDYVYALISINAVIMLFEIIRGRK